MYSLIDAKRRRCIGSFVFDDPYWLCQEAHISGDKDPIVYAQPLRVAACIILSQASLSVCRAAAVFQRAFPRAPLDQPSTKTRKSYTLV